MVTILSKTGRWLLATAVLLSVVSVPRTVLADGKDVLKAIPESTSAFVVVNSIRGTTDSVKAFMDKLAPGLFPPEDPIKGFVGETGLKDSLDDAGPLAILFVNPQEGQHGMALLVPVKDGKAALAGLKAKEDETEKNLYTAEIKDEDTFLAVKGKFLIVGFAKQTVLDILATKGSALEAFSPEQLEAMAKSDLWIRGNVKPLMQLAQPFIGMAMLAAAQQPGMEGVGQIVTELNKMLGELNYVDMVLKLDPAGVKLTFFVQSQPKGMIPNYIEKARKNKVEGGLLAGLPAIGQPILTYGAMQTWDPEYFAFAQKISQMTMKMPGAEGQINQAGMDDVLALGKEWGPLARKSSLVLVSLPAGSDGTMALTALCKLQVSDKPVNIPDMAERMIKAYQKLYTDPKVADMLKRVTFKANAEKVGGKTVHTISFDLKGLVPDEKDAAKLNEAIKKVIGSDGLSVRIIEVAPDTVISTFGGGLKYAEEAVKAASGTEAPLAKDATLVKAAAQLQADRLMEFYLSVDNLITAIKGIGEAVGAPLPLTFKPVNAALAVGTGIVGTDTLRCDVYIPTDLITQIKDLMETVGGGHKAPELPGGDF